ncbi:Hypothetical protein SRAE_1000193100 [Strongyloides ratti]|uniref:Uncharacterized protein n=1 Tax=Strongyloides ratti TaxID=34506 RepID=A0A090L6E2_STRRB|nr:Hypothetical protein SRAE_1000193100 [Strongyloides ratti]CEF63673.1 Hypothetical protein SRAE_1000193100 [Strongyloides ratti]
MLSEYENLKIGSGRKLINGFSKNIFFINVYGPRFELYFNYTSNIYYKPEPLDKIIVNDIFGGNIPKSLKDFNDGINYSNIKGAHVEKMKEILLSMIALNQLFM